MYFVTDCVCFMAQALRNLVNKSRQRIAAVYSELEKKLKYFGKKEGAPEQMRRGNQDGNNEVCGDFENPIPEKIRTV